MSYAAVRPAFYEMLTPDSPWHAGAPGWSSAPFPGWGENPNLVGPPRVAVNGLRGAGCGCSRGVGDEDEPPTKPPGPRGNPDSTYDPTLLGKWPMYLAIGLGVTAIALLVTQPKFLTNL